MKQHVLQYMKDNCLPPGQVIVHYKGKKPIEFGKELEALGHIPKLIQYGKLAGNNQARYGVLYMDEASEDDFVLMSKYVMSTGMMFGMHSEDTMGSTTALSSLHEMKHTVSFRKSGASNFVSVVIR